MTTITREQFTAAIEAGIEACEGLEPHVFGAEDALALRAVAANADRALVGIFYGDDNGRATNAINATCACPATQAVGGPMKWMDGAGANWTMRFAGAFDDYMGSECDLHPQHTGIPVEIV